MKKPVPFLRQKRETLQAICELFGNTNVARHATKEAMLEIRDMANEFIATLDADEQDGVKEEFR